MRVFGKSEIRFVNVSLIFMMMIFQYQLINAQKSNVVINSQIQEIEGYRVFISQAQNSISYRLENKATGSIDFEILEKKPRSVHQRRKPEEISKDDPFVKRLRCIGEATNQLDAFCRKNKAACGDKNKRRSKFYEFLDQCEGKFTIVIF